MTRVVGIVQARTGSTRLPGKVLQEVSGQPMLSQVIERVRCIAGVQEVVVATSTNPADRAIAAIAQAHGIRCFAGSESDVLDRYYRAARDAKADAVVRITADCPLLDPEVSGWVVARFAELDVDYVSNTHPATFPDGLDTEVFSFSALERSWHEATLPADREHVTPYIWTNPGKFRLANVARSPSLEHHRWTVDDPQDLEFVRAVYLKFQDRRFGLEEILAATDSDPELSALMGHAGRNAGLTQQRNQENL